MTINTNAPEYVKNQKLIQWVAEVAALTKPDKIRCCDGSQAEYDEFCELLVNAGVSSASIQPNAKTLSWPCLILMT